DRKLLAGGLNPTPGPTRPSHGTVGSATHVVSAPEEGQHRVDPAMPTVAVGQPQLGEDVADVFVHRVHGHHDLLGDLRVVEPLRHQSQDLALPGGEGLQGITWTPGQQLLHDRRVHHGPTPGDLVQCVHELTDPADPILEQVPHPTTAVREKLTRVVLFDVLRQYQHRQTVVPVTRPELGVDTLVPKIGRQADIHDGQIRCVP